MNPHGTPLVVEGVLRVPDEGRECNIALSGCSPQLSTHFRRRRYGGSYSSLSLSSASLSLRGNLILAEIWSARCMLMSKAVPSKVASAARAIGELLPNEVAHEGYWSFRSKLDNTELSKTSTPISTSLRTRGSGNKALKLAPNAQPVRTNTTRSPAPQKLKARPIGGRSVSYFSQCHLVAIFLAWPSRGLLALVSDDLPA